MATKSNVSKIAYVYDAATNTWYPLAGAANTSADYVWGGDHTFSPDSAVSFETVVKSKAGINNFVNPAARDAALPNPVKGLVAFVAQNAAGVEINDIQIYDGARWRSSNDSVLLSPIVNPAGNTYQILPEDAGTTLNVSSSSDVTIVIPASTTLIALGGSTYNFKVGQKIEVIRSGTGNVTFAAENGNVTLNSKNANKKIAAQHSGAVLTKMDTNTWLIIGDLTA